MSIQKQFLKSKQACKVTFSLPKEAVNGVHEIKVLGDFNDWGKNNALTMKVKNGAYSASIELETGKEYQFRYLIDSEIWENDSEADKYLPTDYGVENSVVVTFSPQ